MSYTNRALAAAASILLCSPAFSGNVTLQGNCVKIGTSDRGTIGSMGNTSPGILYDSTCTGTFNPSYDYLTPGNPFEGWTIKGIDTDGTTVLFTNTNNNNGSPVNVTGTNVDYSGLLYKGYTYDHRAVWSGSTTNFNIEHDVRFNSNQQFVDINTTIEILLNVPTLYFGRFTDPDARAAAGDSSATLNTRGYAGGIPATNVVLSEALASKYALGLFTAATNSNTGVSAGWTTDPIEYYNGVTSSAQGDHTIGLGFMFSGVNAGDIINIQYAYIFGPSAFAAGSTAVAEGAGGSTPTSFTVVDAGSASAPVTPPPAPTPAPTPPPAPTATGTSTSDSVSSSTSSSSRTETSYVTRTETSTDADGNPVVRTYTDTVVTTIPVTTTTTTTTPVTTTTWSDGSTTTSTGSSTSSSSDSDGSGTSVVTGTTLNATAVTRPSVSISDAPVASLPQIKVSLTEHTASEDKGVQKIARHTTVTTTTAMEKTIVTTPVTTTTAADGTETSANGTPATTYELWNDVGVAYNDDALYGKINQYEILDGINNSVNGYLNHEPSKTKEKFRVFGNSRYVWSSADGYNADSRIFGGGFEYDIKPTWTVGAQYNNVNINLNGTDSSSNQKKDHVGIFNALSSKRATLITNVGFSKNVYDIKRTVGEVFFNQSFPKGNEWWVHNRFYVHPTTGVSPYIGYTVGQFNRDGYTETGSIQSARTVGAVRQFQNTGEVGLKLQHRIGDFGVSVDGSYATDKVAGASASVDYKEIIFVEGNYDTDGVVSNTSGTVKLKFRF